MRILHLIHSSYEARICFIFYLFVFSHIRNSGAFSVSCVRIVCICTYFSVYKEVSISRKLH